MAFLLHTPDWKQSTSFSQDGYFSKLEWLVFNCNTNIQNLNISKNSSIIFYTCIYSLYIYIYINTVHKCFYKQSKLLKK